ncbi:MAG TPA: acyltransferase [Acidobacteriaceae bacterium]
MSSPDRSETTVVTGNTARTRPENRAFYPALDGLRALAFLMVFSYHYLEVPWGWTGVDVFFVLSGFLITGILFDTRDDSHRVRNFYVRRTLRIFPLYYGVMIGILALIPVMHWEISWKWLVWPAYIGNFARFFHPYADNSAVQKLADFQPTAGAGLHHVKLYLGHFWSLCVEEQFYLFWPWLVFWVRDRRRLAWLCALSVPACLALRLLGQHFLPGWMLQGEILYRLTPLRLDALLLGGLLALLLRGSRREWYLRMGRRLFPLIAMIVLALLLARPGTPPWHRPYTYPDWKFTWGLTAVDLLSGMVILTALQAGTVVCRVFSIRPLRWLGRISYGAYVLHDIPHPIYAMLCTKLVQHLTAGSALSAHTIARASTQLTALIALVGTLVLSWLSYRWLESPFLNLKERWTARVIH